MKKKLTNPPSDKRDRELWMQHGAGYIVFENIRKSAISKIPSEADNTLREAHLIAIDNTIYGMMMQMDGIFGSLENENYCLDLQTNIVLYKDGEVVEELNTLEGDGMCMGFHGWIENDFGSDEIVTD
ncbi:hypothetical protein OZ664_06005 [Elizabethkingia sp. HX WHF]|uniref:hypothetical protein n=1 Tax=Elizabethkingia TaxID=308865 RepID=UPI000999513C|nr:MULTISPECIES: hypothetical protein [Elizabethkingia]ATL42667.1 hypothetical protein CQS02_04775 [Elizabethkingia miricola]MCL1637218.1 hypothetical protein [Elizabethkingia bruuniana]MDX8563547.1 hypothetical protein [Elizabethkingia sp. HX WHF]OPC20004.1 hypothetical protein BAY00_10920 [Elizabethkingia bruuniana]